MANYELFFKRSVKKDLRRIDRQHIPAILSCIDEQASNPRPSGCKKLRGQNHYRVRVGDFRIVYEIRENKLVVLVITVKKRSRVY